MRFLIVGEDVGVAKPLAEVAQALVEKGEAIVTFLRNTKDVTLILQSSSTFDGILCGMSSSEQLAEGELAAARNAAFRQIPLMLFADTEWVVAFPWFAEVRNKTRAIFVENEQAGVSARMLFPGTTSIFVSGNPAFEHHFNPTFRAGEIREQIGIPGDEVVVLVPGGKDLEINRLHFSAAIKAAGMLGRPAHVLISLHPGDTNPTESYKDLGSKSVKVIFAAKDRFSGEELVPAANLVVSSASTVGRVASCLRIPVVNFFTESALSRREETTGTRAWPEAEKGAELLVYEDVDTLASYMKDLIDGRIDLREAQAKAHPAPRRGAARSIADEVRRIARK